MKQLIPSVIASLILTAQALPAVAAPWTFRSSPPAKAPGAQDRLTWVAKEESWGAWSEVVFADETGKGRSLWCHYSECGMGIRKAGTAKLYVLKEKDRKEKKLPNGRTATITVFESELSDYILHIAPGGKTRDFDRVSKAGINPSSSVNYPGRSPFYNSRYQSHMTALGSTMLVHPPKKAAAGKPGDKSKDDSNSKKTAPGKDGKKDDQPKEPAKRTDENKGETKKDAVEVPALTPFEKAIINGMGPEAVKEFTAEQTAAIADASKQAAFFKKWREKVLALAETYNHHSWKHTDINAKVTKVEDLFDQLERDFLKQTLSGKTKADYENWRAAAQAALDNKDKDPKAADIIKQFIGTYRHWIKHNMNLYVTASKVPGTIFDAMKQLECLEKGGKAASGSNGLEEAKGQIDTCGQKAAPPASGTGATPPATTPPATSPTPAKPPVVSPVPAPDPGLGDKIDAPKKADEEKKGHDWKKYSKGGGMLFGIGGLVLGMLFGGPVGALVGAAIGFGVGYGLHYFYG